MSDAKSGKEKGSHLRTGTSLRQFEGNWIAGFQYGSPRFVLAYSISELMKTQPTWNANIRPFTDQQIASGRAWLMEISHADLKNPILFIWACQVMFEEQESEEAYDFKNANFVWYTDHHTFVQIEPWHVYQYVLLLRVIDEKTGDKKDMSDMGDMSDMSDNDENSL